MDADDHEPPDPLLDALAATPAGEVLTRAMVLDDQFRIERVIGEGGMGVVYRARDLRLDRDVAIKVSLERSAATLARLSREALALARLSHPNVVVIYQVGELDGRPYVVMEYVAGGTARQWCATRTPREILALYIAAGHGLAAAHAAALVHGDFKPDNVLVGSDGRPRVADFGLSRPSIEAAEAREARETVVSRRDATTPTTRTTRAGAGTAPYMAPEQLAHRPPDPRADQFAYCVSLWEALFGERPFSARTPDPASLTVPERPAGANVPKHVEQALRRGLAFSPEERWPSLELLLEELEREPPRPRVAAVALGTELVAVVTAVISLVQPREPAAVDPCAAGAAAMGEHWSEARAAQLRDHLAPPGSRRWLVESAARTTGNVDAWTGTWSERYGKVCAASRAWSESLITRGYACLDQRKRELVAMLDVLATAPDVGARADAMFDRLVSPEVCGDADYLASAVPPPTDPVLAVEVSRLGDALAKLDALIAAAQDGKTKDLLDAIVAKARQLDYAPLRGRVLLERGAFATSHDDGAGAFAQLHEAYFAARASRDEETAAVSAANAALALLSLSRDGEAAEWARLAAADAAVAGAPDAALGAAAAQAAVSHEDGDPKLALEQAESFVRLARAKGARVVEALRIRAQAHDRLGDYTAALADLDDADQALRAAYGEHPRLVELLANRALVLLHVDRPDDAVATARRAVELAARITGDESAVANTALATLATTLKSAHRMAEALPIFDRTTAFDRAHGGARSYNVASDLNDHADALSSLRRIDEAIPLWVEAASIFQEIEGTDSYDAALVEYNLWNGLYEARRTREGGPHLARALPIFAKTPKTQVYAQALVAQALTEVEEHQLDRAREHAEAGMVALGKDDHVHQMRARVALAKVALARRDRPTAQRWLAAAMHEARASGPDDVAEIEELMKK